MFIKRAALVFLLSITLLIALHQSILHFTLQFYLSHAAKQAGYVLAYKEIRATPHTLTLISPQIAFGEKKGALQAETLLIGYKLHPFSRTLDLEITFDRPHMELHKESVNLESLFESFISSSSWIKVNGKIVNKEASILLADLEKPISFQVSSDHSWGATRAAHYQIFCEGTDHCLEVAYNETGGHIEAEDIKAESVAQLLHALLPSLEPWICSNGTLQGHFSFNQENGRITSAGGELAINDLSFCNPSMGIHATLPKLLLKATPAGEHLATIEFLQSALDFVDKKSPYGNLHNLSGKIHISKDLYVTLLSEGVWNASDESSLVALHASVDLPHLAVAAVQLELNHLARTKRLPASNSRQPH